MCALPKPHLRVHVSFCRLALRSEKSTGESWGGQVPVGRPGAGKTEIDEQGFSIVGGSGNRRLIHPRSSNGDFASPTPGHNPRTQPQDRHCVHSQPQDRHCVHGPLAPALLALNRGPRCEDRPCVGGQGPDARTGTVCGGRGEGRCAGRGCQARSERRGAMARRNSSAVWGR